MSIRRHRVLKCLVVSAIVLLFVGLGIAPQRDPGAAGTRPILEVPAFMNHRDVVAWAP